MGTILTTIAVAVGGVFVVFGIWLLVDQLARKQLGDRPQGCGGHHGGAGCGHCQMKDECDEESPECGPTSDRPAE